MKQFDVDLYLWTEDLQDWLLVPSAGSALRWPAPGVSRSEFLASNGGMTFRIDSELWLGNERDGLPLDMIVFALERSVRDEASDSLLARLPISEHLSIEIRLSDDQERVLLSRLCTRVASDYLEQTAVAVGSYYKDFAVDARLWRQAVNRTLDGLAAAFAGTTSSEPEQASVLADWLRERHRGL